jgi:hypothetical protein
MLARFDAAVAEARQRLSAGDAQGASRALDTARGIDPTAPSVGDLSYQLSELRAKQAAVQDNRRDRSIVGLTGSQSRPGRDAQGRLPQRGGTSSLPPPAPAPMVPPDAEPPSSTPPRPSSPSSGAPATSPGAPAPPTPPEPRAPETKAPESKPAEARSDKQPSSAAPEDDDAVIRRLVANYGRAIESKDLALFRAIKPNLSAQEERRLRDGFRDVTSQRVTLTVLSIAHHGDEASVSIRRRDVIQAGGRQQTAESHQTLQLSRTNGGWVITDIR